MTTHPLKLAMWTGSIGLVALLVRRYVRARRERVDVGRVSDYWLAHVRTGPDDASW